MKAHPKRRMAGEVKFMHTKSAIFFTLVMLSGVAGTGCESASDTAGEDSTLAALGVDLRDPAVRAEWEAKCAGDADVAAEPDPVVGSDAGAIDDDGDDDADEVAQESSGGGDHDRTDKICRFLEGGWRGHHGGRGDHGRGHGGQGDHDGRFDEHDCDGGSDEDGDDQGDEDDGDDDADEGSSPIDAGAPEGP